MQHLNEGRFGKVLILVDNCRGNTLCKETREDPRFKVMFLPPNTTSLIQSMYQGVIAECKKLFRHKLLQKILQCEKALY